MNTWIKGFESACKRARTIGYYLAYGVVIYNNHEYYPMEEASLENYKDVVAFFAKAIDALTNEEILLVWEPDHLEQEVLEYMVDDWSVPSLIIY